MGAKCFQHLNVHRFARDSAEQVYLRSREFPAEERYSLTDQIRRSSRAVKAMITEAWARRRYKAVFINKLDEALGEANETQSWLDDALDCGYLSGAEHKELDQQYRSISGILARMMDRAADFCKNFPVTDHRSTPARVQEDEAFFAG